MTCISIAVNSGHFRFNVFCKNLFYNIIKFQYRIGLSTADIKNLIIGFIFFQNQKICAHDIININIISNLPPILINRRSFVQKQIEKIKDRSAIVGIVGMGYVGLPLTRSFFEAGFRCVGFDIDDRKVKQLNAGKSYIKHIPSKFLQTALHDKRFRATSRFADLSKMDAIIICVPTPLTKMREPDMSYVTSTCEVVAKYLRKGQLVVLESTTYPGTTRELVLPILAANGLKVERDFYLAFSPEREDPGRKTHTTTTIPKVVGGYGRKSMAVAKALYGAALETVVPVSSCEVAEAAKILENVYRSVNIALINEMKVLLDKMGINVWEVVAAAATKPFGYQPFYPGPGLGGHCIPIDPFYLTWKAREYGMNTRFIELAGEINTQMPEYVITKVAEALNSARKPINGSKVLLLGLAYKRSEERRVGKECRSRWSPYH